MSVSPGVDPWKNETFRSKQLFVANFDHRSTTKTNVFLRCFENFKWLNGRKRRCSRCVFVCMLDKTLQIRANSGVLVHLTPKKSLRNNALFVYRCAPMLLKFGRGVNNAAGFCVDSSMRVFVVSCVWCTSSVQVWQNTAFEALRINLSLAILILQYIKVQFALFHNQSKFLKLVCDVYNFLKPLASHLSARTPAFQGSKHNTSTSCFLKAYEGFACPPRVRESFGSALQRASCCCACGCAAARKRCPMSNVQDYARLLEHPTFIDLAHSIIEQAGIFGWEHQAAGARVHKAYHFDKMEPQSKLNTAPFPPTRPVNRVPPKEILSMDIAQKR